MRSSGCCEPSGCAASVASKRIREKGPSPCASDQLLLTLTRPAPSVVPRPSRRTPCAPSAALSFPPAPVLRVLPAPLVPLRLLAPRERRAARRRLLRPRVLRVRLRLPASKHFPARPIPFCEVSTGPQLSPAGALPRLGGAKGHKREVSSQIKTRVTTLFLQKQAKVVRQV